MREILGFEARGTEIWRKGCTRMRWNVWDGGERAQRRRLPGKKIESFSEKSRICHSHRKLPSRVHGRNGVSYLYCVTPARSKSFCAICRAISRCLCPGNNTACHYIYIANRVSFTARLKARKCSSCHVISSYLTLKATVELSLVRGKSCRK